MAYLIFYKQWSRHSLELMDYYSNLFKVIKEGVMLREDYEVTIEDRKGKKIQGGKFTMKDDAKLYIKDMIKKHKLKKQLLT